ncbi:schlafen-like protein 1 [Biomphalaria pfeifferi]|uniref:Schlafen-like protein 1 n=1 Tax=Biomphalaria pfeifferi TaxID=112525 RepID=A0AAD8BLN6_BIOPF|nr:schlafen-like protein 1 [Biomphalaria pfeifferi]
MSQSTSAPVGQDGIVLHPILQNVSEREMTKHIHKLLRAVRIAAQDVKDVIIQRDYAEVILASKEAEEHALKLLQDPSVVMGLYNLRNITPNPKTWVVEKIQTFGRQVPSRLPGTKSLTTSGSATKLQTKSTTEKSQRPQTTAVATSGAHAQSDKPDTSKAGSSMSESQVEKSPKQSFLMKKRAELTKVQGTPVFVSVKTSTAEVKPCGCPETIFYHHLQNIGTETRHAEFKKGGVINERYSFRDMVGKYMCGFLNSEGGTIFFGVNDSGVVLGLDLDPQYEAALKRDITCSARMIEPHVSTSEYSVNFARVMERTGDMSLYLKVLEICVKPRDPPERLYSYKDIIYMRRDGSLQNLGHVDDYQW